MLEKLTENQVLFYFASITILLGTIIKVMVSISLKRLVKAASNMSKSNHSLMRLVRAKYEHACMVSDKVQNVPAFVDKYLYEYKVMGIYLHSLRQLEKSVIWLCGGASILGGVVAYFLENDIQNLQKYIYVGAGGVLFLLLLQVTMGEQSKLEAAKMYMVEFLENTYAHRYEKTMTREKTEEIHMSEKEMDKSEEKSAGKIVENVVEKVEEQMAQSELLKERENQEAESAKVMRPKFQQEPEVQMVQADKIREILEEFLA